MAMMMVNTQLRSTARERPFSVMISAMYNQGMGPRENSNSTTNRRMNTRQNLPHKLNHIITSGKIKDVKNSKYLPSGHFTLIEVEERNSECDQNACHEEGLKIEQSLSAEF